MRPLKLDDAAQSEVCAILSIGGTRRMAAQYIGCTDRAIYYLAKRDPRFAERLAKTELSSEIKYLKYIADAASDKKYWRAAAWALERMYPGRYHGKADMVSIDLVREMTRHVVEAAMKHVPDARDPRTLRLKLTTIARTVLTKPMNK